MIFITGGLDMGGKPKSNLDYAESLLETYVIENEGHLYLKITYF